MNIDEHQAPTTATLDEALRYVRVWNTVLQRAKQQGDPTREIAGLLGLDRAREIARRALDRHMDAGADALVPPTATETCELCAAEHETDYGRVIAFLERAKISMQSRGGDELVTPHAVYVFNQRGELTDIQPKEQT
jgi:hypothetical protein